MPSLINLILSLDNKDEVQGQVQLVSCSSKREIFINDIFSAILSSLEKTFPQQREVFSIIRCVETLFLPFQHFECHEVLFR